MSFHRGSDLRRRRCDVVCFGPQRRSHVEDFGWFPPHFVVGFDPLVFCSYLQSCAHRSLETRSHLDPRPDGPSPSPQVSHKEAVWVAALYVAVDGVPLRREVVEEVDLGGDRGGAGGSADRMDSRCGPLVWRSEGVAEAKSREASVPSVLDHLDLGNEPAGGGLVALPGGLGGRGSRDSRVAGNHARP